jgi:cellulose synthase (UDP-forming)
MKFLPLGSSIKDSWSKQVAYIGVMLIVTLVYYLHFALTYFTLDKQVYIGWGCLAAMIVLYKIRRARRQPWRLAFLILGAILSFRYMMWRTFETLLYTGPLDFVGMTLVYLAELYGIIIYFMGIFVNVWPLESRSLPLPGQVENLPTVDILIPTYNEPDEIVRMTATAASQIDYPKEKLKVYILDDGSTHAKRAHPETGMSAWERYYRIRQIAEELGVGYITRETNQQAKAGNINHAFQYTEGDLVLILDCDHVPTSDILQRTVGHFISDKKLFLVQTPHFFINPSPIEKNLEGVANPSGENDMFYRKIHPALNFWNASYFCGSAALLRRKCLMEVGGICGTTITEDAETAFNLHSRGYNSIYINRPMVCGLSPESFDDYVIQRSRWAQGMIQLLMLNNPLKQKGLSIPQKIAYFNSSFFWFFGLTRFIYFIAPAMYLIFGLNIYHAAWPQIFAYTLPYLVSSHLVMDYFYSGSRQPFFSEIYESVQSLFLIPAVLSVLVNPWKPAFKVTPKDTRNDKNYLSPLAGPFFVVIGINVTATALAIYQWFAQPILRDVIMVTGVWCIYNLYLSVVSLGAFWERKQVRKFHRINTSGAVQAYFPRLGLSQPGKVKDVSISGIGFEIECDFLPREQDRVMLTVRDSKGAEYHFEVKLQRVIKRGGKYFCGTEFLSERVPYREIVQYVFGDSQRWVDIWDTKSASRGTYRMLWYFFKTGMAGFFGGLYPLFRASLVKARHIGKTLLFTPVVRKHVLATLSWWIYFLYLGLASVIGKVDNKPSRKLQRHPFKSPATVYFPRFDSMLVGETTDVSLTGIGIMANLPMQIRNGEHATIRTTKDGVEYRFPSVIQRAIEREGKFLFGAEFIVDTASYPKIVQFVYGDTMDMLRHIATQGYDLVVQGAIAVGRLIAHAMDVAGMILVFLFLNRESEIQEKLDAWIQEEDAQAGFAERMIKAAVIGLALAFMYQDEEIRQNRLLILKRLLPTEELQHNRRILKRGWLRVVKAKAAQDSPAEARMP